MGMYSYFEGDIDCEEISDDDIYAAAKAVGVFEWSEEGEVDGGLLSFRAYDQKWYSWKEDMKNFIAEINKRGGHVVGGQIYRFGEEHGDVSKLDFCEDQVTWMPGQVTFEDGDVYIV